MPEDQKAAAGAEPQKGKRAAASRRTDAGQLQRRAAEAYTAYATAVADAMRESDPGPRAGEAYGEYLRNASTDWTPERMAERYAEAARAYVRAATAYTSPEQDSVAAFREYVVGLTEQWWPEEARTRARDAYRSYLDGLGDALDPSQLERTGGEAWGEYIARFKEASGELDPTVDPAAVSALAQSALAAATVMRSVRAVVDQRNATRDTIAGAQAS